MKFVRIVQIELSQPTAEARPLKFEVNGVAVHVHRRNPDETETRRFLASAEVPLETRPDISIDGKILISEEIARQAEKAIELLADFLAVTNFSTRKITSAVPTAGFSSLTGDDREWLAQSSGLFQIPSRLELGPAAIGVTLETLSYLDDRRDGVTLLAEALANTHETGDSASLLDSSSGRSTCHLLALYARSQTSLPTMTNLSTPFRRLRSGVVCVI